MKTILTITFCLLSLGVFLYYFVPHTGLDTISRLKISLGMCGIGSLVTLYTLRQTNNRTHQTVSLTTVYGVFLFLFPHIIMVSASILALSKAVYVEAGIQIENYTEEPIYWDSISTPVGLKISFDIVHPTFASGLISTPQVFLSNYKNIPNRDLAYIHFVGKQKSGYYHNLRYLSVPTWNKKDRQEDNFRFDRSGRTTVSFYLYPDKLMLIEPNKFCMVHNQLMTDYVLSDGNGIAALWLAVQGDGVYIDMSYSLTTVLKQGRLLHDTKLWKEIFSNFDSKQGIIESYHPCEVNTLSKTRDCYCK